MPEQTKQDPLKHYQAIQRDLAALVARQLNVATALGSEELRQAAEALGRRVAEDVFRVMVLGEFKRGKSTVINALLGAEVLPSSSLPCTAAITVVKYGRPRRAVLHPRDGRAPFEIPVEKLIEHITIDEQHEKTENEYKLAEVYWPLELCRDGVQLADSPGTNEDQIRDAVTGGYLKEADAIVYVVTAVSPFSDSEGKYLETFVLPLGHREIFFVLSRIDQVNAKERDRLIESVRRKISRLGQDGPEGGPVDAAVGSRLFPLNASAALEGRLAGDQAVLAQSGLGAFEDALTHFLAEEKGRVKFAGASGDLRYRLSQARALIHDRELMNHRELAELEAAYEAQRPRLELLDQKRAVIVGALENDIRGLEREVEDSFRAKLIELAGQCPQWAEQTETEVRVGSLFKAKEQGEALAAELAGSLTERLREEIQRWQAAELTPLLEQRIKPLQEQLDRDVAEFLSLVQDVRAAITGEQRDQVAELADVVLGSYNGAFGGMTPQAGQVAGISLTGLLLSQLGVLIAGALLSFTPLGLLTAMLSVGKLQSTFQTGRVDSKVRQTVGEAYAAQVREGTPDTARAAGRALGDRLRDQAEATKQGLAAQTATVREQVNAAIQDKKDGAERVALQQAELHRLTLEVESVEHARGELANRINAAA